MADGQQGDLVLLPGQQCLLTDETKGSVTQYVGPSATPLGGNLTPVIYDPVSGSFERARGRAEEAIQQCPTASEGQYLILHNPAVGDNKHPQAGQPAPMADLQTGKTQVFHGPVTMALYPGQWAEVLDGHRLDPSQYLVIEIVNDEEARAHWSDAEMKRQTATAAAPAPDAKGDEGTTDTSTAVLDEQQIPDFTTGSRLVIRGDKFSFYMPPTGVRVVPIDQTSKSFVRKACTLERLQYCILVNSKGEKRFPKGPQVVYPAADEEFVTNDGSRGDSRIHRAIELSKISGIYVKVTADYKDEADVEHKAGDELFITGDTSAIYYPRPEHAVIRYGDREIHFATVIPDGEGVHVLNRLTGEIRIERGHKTLLPDPRTDVIVRRVLDTNICELYFPGNREALLHNQMLTANRGGGAAAASASVMNTDRYMTANFASGRGDDEEEAKLAGDAFARGTTYSEPRSIVLDTKYNGAVRISPWNNYAVMINSASGNHRVVEGPATILLEWDESLEVLKLSTGTPKDHDRVIRTVYLKVKNNTVSHVIEAVTKDFCQVDISVTFRVNFEVPADASPEQVDAAKIKWFGVENYIEFLCVHMESLIRNTVRQYTVAEFNDNQTAIIRDTVLGPSLPDADGKSSRKGRTFEENGMRVYDVEVSSVSIDDEEVDKLLSNEQRATFRQQMEKQEAQRKLEKTQQAEKNAQDEAEAKAETQVKQHDLKMEQIERVKDEEVATIEATKAKSLATLLAEKEQALAAAEAEKVKEELRQGIAALQQDIRDLEASRTLAREKATAEQKQGIDTAIQALALAELSAHTDAKTKLMAAVAPDVVAALEQLGDAQLAKAMTEAAANWAPLLGTQSLAGVMETVFGGTPLGDVVTKMVKRS